ncbi:MAG: DASS family sodium-coupled anion symporter [Sporomusaceae bacterium]|nr:DASS family sodium-coupled anion symporter [Sporomusaceae bacterium]
MSEVIKKNPYKPIHIGIALAILIGIVLLPNPDGLSIAGHRMLGVLAFAVYIWISEAMPFPVSGIAITFLMIMLLGLSPEKGVSGKLLGTGKAIPMAMSGFVNSGWVLVAAGLFLAEAVRFTGLDRRIAVNILRVVGTEPKKIIGGMIIAGFLLSFIIPSIAARAAALIPVALGLITALKVDKKSAFAKQIMLVTGFTAAITGGTVLTAGAPNPFTVGLLASQLNHTITWLDWFIYAGPFTVVLGIIMYVLVITMNKFEKLEGGEALIAKYMTELGPMTSKEKRIGWIFAFTILLWGTEHTHHIDANTITVFAALLIFLTQVATWKEMSDRVGWGTLVLFGAGITIGEVLLKTGAAAWAANAALGHMGLQSMSAAMILATISVPIIVIRVAFSSIVALAAIVVPTMLGLLTNFNNPDIPIWSVTLISSFLVYFSFLLPVNTPATLLTYSTGTYEQSDMLKIGIPLTLLGLGAYILFVNTYWHWLGLI